MRKESQREKAKQARKVIITPPETTTTTNNKNAQHAGRPVYLISKGVLEFPKYVSFSSSKLGNKMKNEE